MKAVLSNRIYMEVNPSLQSKIDNGYVDPQKMAETAQNMMLLNLK